MRHRFLLLLGLSCALSTSLLYGVADAWNPSLPDAKRIARENNRPLIVVAGNSRSCTWCRDFDSKVIAKADWEEYAERKGIPQYYADGGYTVSYPVMRALFQEYYYANLPTVFIFKVKPGADLTTMNLDAATSVELIGKYVNVPNVKINGLTVANTPARFIQVLESFYKTTHPEWLADLGATPAGAPLTVSLLPAGALAAGAQWQVDGGAWKNSGATVDLAAGQHTVSYKAIADWVAPQPQAVTIAVGVPQALQATYTPAQAMGSLTVTLTGPAEGAWRVVGDATWRASGDTVSLAEGTYTIEFQGVVDWITPSPLLGVAVTAGEAAAAAAAYRDPNDGGWLEVTLAPARAIAAGATCWACTGDPEQVIPFDATGRAWLPAGEYCVKFLGIHGWTTPPGLDAIIVTKGADLAFTATYGHQFGTAWNPYWSKTDAGGEWLDSLWSMDTDWALSQAKPVLLWVSGMQWPDAAATFRMATLLSCQPVVDLITALGVIPVMADIAAPAGAKGAAVTSLMHCPDYLSALLNLTGIDYSAQSDAKLAAHAQLFADLGIATPVTAPMLLMVRADGSLAGRLDGLSADATPDSLADQIGDLVDLSADPHEESNNTPATGWSLDRPATHGTPQTAFTTGAVLPTLGGPDPADWMRFTPASNTQWSFAFSVSEGAPQVGAAVTLGVYDSTGNDLLRQVTAPLDAKNGLAPAATLAVALPGFGKGTPPASYLLRVQLEGQDLNALTYALTYQTASFNWSQHGVLAVVALGQDDGVPCPPPANAAWRWRPNAGGDWSEWLYGSTATLPAGLLGIAYRVGFQTILGWQTPAEETTTVKPGQTATITGNDATYTKITGGDLTVTLTGPVDRRWQATGTAPDALPSAEQPSGATLTLPPGTYVVSFTAVGGWIAPNPANVEITFGGHATVNAAYDEITTGTLTVALNPGTAVAAGAGWRLTTDPAGQWRASGDDATLEEGDYTIKYKPIAGWTTPADRAVTIERLEGETVTATYAPMPDFVNRPTYAVDWAVDVANTTILPVVNLPADRTLGAAVNGKPAWMTVSYLQAGDQGGPAVVLTGTPTNAGSATVTLAIRATKDGAATTEGGQTVVTVTSKEPLQINPDAVGNFTGTILEENVKGPAAVRGTLTMTVADTGRITAKLVTLAKTYSYRISSWSAVDIATQTLTATSTDGALTLSIGPDDQGEGTFTAPGTTGPVYALELDRVDWHRTANPATAYEGYYTVSLPVTDRLSDAKVQSFASEAGGYLVFTVKADGKVTFSGKVADGTRFSGSSVVVETPFGSARFPIFVPLYSRQGWLAGQLEIFPGGPSKVFGYNAPGSKAADPYWQWSYPGKSPTRGQTADAFTTTLYPYGVGYDKGMPLEDDYLDFTEVTWSLDATTPITAAYGYTANGTRSYVSPQPRALPFEMALTAANKRLTAPKATAPVRQADGTYAYAGVNPSALTIKYSASTGVFSGSFKFYYDYESGGRQQHKAVTAKFEGVLTPECRGCSADPLPLGFGYVVGNDASAEQTIGYAVKRGYPVYLDDANPLEDPVEP